MRWRLMPALQTEKVAGTRCLLMGAGTLGCAVARCLLGWGVRNITFVDAGVVSYSNPVRQTLFNFEDCISGDTPKAQAAADALKRIFPSVAANAHRIAIPMPGHAVGESETVAVAADCEKLSSLVQEHDVSATPGAVRTLTTSPPPAPPCSGTSASPCAAPFAPRRLCGSASDSHDRLRL